MRIRFLFISLFFIFFFFGLISAKNAFASSINVSGRVSDNADNSIVNATLDFTDVNTNNNVVSTTTDSFGNYSVSVEGGIYNILVMPPPNSNFFPVFLSSRNISSDSIINFVFAPQGAVVLNGHIYNQDGNPMQGIRVILDGNSSQAATTDSSGAYSLQKVPGTYSIRIVGDLITASPDITSPSLNLSQSRVLDVTFPFKKVNTHVENSSGDPVMNVKIDVGSQSNISFAADGVQFTGSSSINANTGNHTDAGGNVELLLFAGNNYIFDAIPPQNSAYTTTTLNNVNVNSDTTVNIILTSPVTLDGHIYDQDGDPMQGVRVVVDQNAIAVQATTNSLGFYSLQKTPGTYSIHIFADLINSSPDITASSVNLSQNRVLDVTFPFKRVTTHVQDLDGNPVSNVKIDVGSQSNINFSAGGVQFTGSTSVNSNTGNHTDAGGNVELLLFTGSNYIFQAIPAENSIYTGVTINNVSVSSDTTVNITLISPITLSGYIYDQDGNPMQGVRITVDMNGIPIHAITDSLGAYSLQKVPGTYTIRIVGDFPHTSVELNSLSIDLGHSSVLDVTFPFKKIATRVQDQSGNPIANVKIDVGSQSNINFSAGGVQFTGVTSVNALLGNHTDTNGNVELLLFTGNNYTFQAIPPPNSIYNTVTLNNINITSDQTEIISLQFVHDPPVTTATLSPTPNAQGEYPDPVTVTLSATASSGFTVANTSYKIDGGTTQAYSSPFTVSGEGDHTIKYWSIDNVGVFESPNTKTFTINSNHPPTANAGGPYEIAEGGSMVLQGSGTDPDSDVLTYAWDLDNNGSYETSGQTPVFSAATLDGPSTKTVGLQVCDTHNACATSQATVNIFNIPPMVNTISVSSSPVSVNTPISLSANFTDPGVLDTHTAVWDFGDGTTSTGTVTETNGSGSVSDNHTYTSAGTYTITLAVIDKDGGMGTSQFQYVVVYDPSAGFVTGGGTITSPQGAYTPNPSFTGKAIFGFVSKYQKGANLPSGNTEFQFKVANFNFHSTSYDWLVIGGAKAQYKGTGTVNGNGDYGFILTAIDGQILGGGGADKFRLKVWDITKGSVIYDNLSDEEIDSGSITIHKYK